MPLKPFMVAVIVDLQDRSRDYLIPFDVAESMFLHHELARLVIHPDVTEFIHLPPSFTRPTPPKTGRT